jgi:dTDP-4-amino-4,6-dideoxygalactose transaminase
LEEAFPSSMRPSQRLPVAKVLGETSLMFLVHPTLSDEYLHHVGQTAKQVLNEAAGVASQRVG